MFQGSLSPQTSKTNPEIKMQGEEHVFNTILSQRLGWHLDPGEDTPNLLETHRKLARRSRFQRECRAKYGTNILEHYTRDEAHALKSIQWLRLAASGMKHRDGRYDDDSLAVYTKQDILNELPNDAIIYSGNSNPGPKPGSVPRGIFAQKDYCWPPNKGRGLPPPSGADLFSPRPLPDLSLGRKPVTLPQQVKREKRAREEDPNPMSQKKRGKVVATD